MLARVLVAVVRVIVNAVSFVKECANIASETDASVRVDSLFCFVVLVVLVVQGSCCGGADGILKTDCGMFVVSVFVGDWKNESVDPLLGGVALVFRVALVDMC